MKNYQNIQQSSPVNIPKNLLENFSNLRNQNSSQSGYIKGVDEQKSLLSDIKESQISQGSSISSKYCTETSQKMKIESKNNEENPWISRIWQQSFSASSCRTQAKADSQSLSQRTICPMTPQHIFGKKESYETGGKYSESQTIQEQDSCKLEQKGIEQSDKYQEEVKRIMKNQFEERNYYEQEINRLQKNNIFITRKLSDASQTLSSKQLKETSPQLKKVQSTRLYKDDQKFNFQASLDFKQLKQNFIFKPSETEDLKKQIIQLTYENKQNSLALEEANEDKIRQQLKWENLLILQQQEFQQQKRIISRKCKHFLGEYAILKKDLQFISDKMLSQKKVLDSTKQQIEKYVKQVIQERNQNEEHVLEDNILIQQSISQEKNKNKELSAQKEFLERILKEKEHSISQMKTTLEQKDALIYHLQNKDKERSTRQKNAEDLLKRVQIESSQEKDDLKLTLIQIQEYFTEKIEETAKEKKKLEFQFQKSMTESSIKREQITEVQKQLMKSYKTNKKSKNIQKSLEEMISNENLQFLEFKRNSSLEIRRLQNELRTLSSDNQRKNSIIDELSKIKQQYQNKISELSIKMNTSYMQSKQNQNHQNSNLSISNHHNHHHQFLDFSSQKKQVGGVQQGGELQSYFNSKSNLQTSCLTNNTQSLPIFPSQFRFHSEWNESFPEECVSQNKPGNIIPQHKDKQQEQNKEYIDNHQDQIMSPTTLQKAQYSSRQENMLRGVIGQVNLTQLSQKLQQDKVKMVQNANSLSHLHYGSCQQNPSKGVLLKQIENPLDPYNLIYNQQSYLEDLQAGLKGDKKVQMPNQAQFPRNSRFMK